MSRLARALLLGAMLAAVNLAGTSAVAQEQADSNDSVRRYLEQFQGAERPPQQQMDRNAGVRLYLQHFHRAEGPSQEQPAVNATLRRVLAREHHQGGGVPTEVISRVEPSEASGQPGSVVALAVLAAALTLAGALVATTTRRARRGVGARPAA